MRWQITAEHTAGKSAGHCCSTGAYSDPTDLLDLQFSGPLEEAYQKGEQELEKLRQEAQNNPCACGKSDRVSYDSWADSKTIIVEPLDEEAQKAYAAECGIEPD
jgi:hypothetical protein